MWKREYFKKESGRGKKLKCFNILQKKSVASWLLFTPSNFGIYFPKYKLAQFHHFHVSITFKINRDEKDGKEFHSKQEFMQEAEFLIVSDGGGGISKEHLNSLYTWMLSNQKVTK